jgi:alkanesulfonate monooxygenase SsuD/methylene tetrahydromethanopterin reductase-like flavin-dependent oxidoreductase (luciferase family)
VLQRVARLGDGWLPGHRTAAAAAADLAKLDGYLAENGRARVDIGLEPRLHYTGDNLDELQQIMTGWQAVGASHISVNTMGAGLDTPDKHLAAIQAAAQLLAA